MSRRVQHHQYFAKQVAELTGIDDPIRVKLYSDVAAYGIDPLHVGSGRGSRKIYSFDDVLRIAVAEELSRFGFNASAIGAALAEIKKSELDPEGSFYLVQNRKLSSADFDWEVISRADAEKQRRERPHKAAFILDLTATVVPVWQRAEELASSGEKE
jgi:DNA-binding transcriptional MerR regulator